MSIKLSFYLNRNKSNLKQMCEQLSIKSYSELLEHCFSATIDCDVSQKEYDEIFNKKEVVKNESKKRNSTPKSKTAGGTETKAKTRRRGRKPKAKTDGNADK